MSKLLEVYLHSSREERGLIEMSSINLVNRTKLWFVLNRTERVARQVRDTAQRRNIKTITGTVHNMQTGYMQLRIFI